MKKNALFISIFISCLSIQSQASSVSPYKVTCNASLAGDVSKGEAPVRTELEMTFCGLEISGMMPPSEGETFGAFWINDEFSVCADQDEAGVAYDATRSDGSTYEGFIAAQDGNKPEMLEESKTYFIGSVDGEYFEYSSQEDSPSIVKLVREGASRMLVYNFELANCAHQYVDFEGNLLP